MARGEQLKKTFGRDKNKLLTFKIMGDQTLLNNKETGLRVSLLPASDSVNAWGHLLATLAVMQ